MTRAESTRSAKLAPILLVLATALAYGPVLGADFLNYDDPWLIIENPFLRKDGWTTLLAAFTDFSRDTRLSLGAEYLPLRDVLVWLETRIFGMSAAPMHAVSLALYLASLLFLRSALLEAFSGSLWVEAAVYLFALHPVHVESVAWLAGQKDVLALLFVCAALYAHAKSRPGARVVVPLLVLAACLSKSMSVAVIALFGATDLVLRRRPCIATYAGSTLAIVVTMAAHLYVGRIVGMLAAPAGGSRYTALITMSPVWLRYLGKALLPIDLSIAYDVPDRTSWDAEACAGLAFVLASGALAAWALARQRRLPAFAFVWFFAPLAPVSQIIAPLQNRMADRYLWLSVLAPCVLGAAAASSLARRLPGRLSGLGVGASFATVLGLAFVLTFDRAVTFSNSVLLFADATQKTELDTDAPYQLGKALEAEGRSDEAMSAYREVLARAEKSETGELKKPTNNLARLLARRGRLPEAEHLLERALVRHPKDPKLTKNLVKVLRGMGRDTEADARERELSQAKTEDPSDDPRER